MCGSSYIYTERPITLEGKRRARSRHTEARHNATRAATAKSARQARSMATSQSHLSPPSHQHRIVETIRSATEVARGKPRRAQRTSRSSGVSYIYTVRPITLEGKRRARSRHAEARHNATRAATSKSVRQAHSMATSHLIFRHAHISTASLKPYL